MLERKAYIVWAACTLFNFSIGALYAWSVLATQMREDPLYGGLGWTAAEAGLPFTFATIFCAIGALIGGRIQDKIGPRKVMTAGGALMGLGLILSGVFVSGEGSVLGLVLAFGVMSGLGMGSGYACTTPSALKWFHPGKKGLVSGVIVGGLGLSAVAFAPLASALLGADFSIRETFLFMGIGVLVISVLATRFVTLPPAGYVPTPPTRIRGSGARSKPVTAAVDLDWKEVLKKGDFYVIFIMYLFSASVGLMVFGVATNIGYVQANIYSEAVLAGLVVLMAVINTLGRVAGGVMSDKIGRENSLYVIFGLQAVNMALFGFYTTLPFLIIGIVIVGFCFGATLSVMPAICADRFGLKNFGMNYGILFLAWGFSGAVAPVIATNIFDSVGNFDTAYIICAVMMAVMFCVNFLLKKRDGGHDNEKI